MLIRCLFDVFEGLFEGVFVMLLKFFVFIYKLSLMEIDCVCVDKFLVLLSVIVVGFSVCKLFVLYFRIDVFLMNFNIDKLEENCVDWVVGKMWLDLFI